jgi:hypothetical protein
MESQRKLKNTVINTWFHCWEPAELWTLPLCDQVLSSPGCSHCPHSTCNTADRLDMAAALQMHAL